ncbi:multidrug efflux SMR transporter [Duganella sp. FT27W]|uniref:DMT family transporter n=1 Tax=Duganella sp. FT27W TaxID=2654636 RepID=UPI00128C6F0D|nr:multidrug efflux SMR transporter [Duganella sp. FT27W]MPQ57083.1 EamA family transporter [Duganella sp. FT27W]
MNPHLWSWAALGGAIACEVVATGFLNKSEQFSKLAPTLVSLGLYGVSFYLLAQALRTVPLGVAYAVWGGLGIVLTAIVSIVVFKQRLDWIAMVGIGFIVVGVIIVNAFSKAGGH